MTLNLKRFIVVSSLLCLISQSILLSGAIPLQASALGVGEFEDAIVWLLRNDATGTSIVRRLTGVTEGHITDATYRSFMERLKWSSTQPLNTELRLETAKIETAFEDYRTQQGRPAKLAPGEALLPDEQQFLEQAAAGLRGNGIENLMKEQLTFVDASVGSKPAPGSYRASEAIFQSTVTAPEGEIPARPDPEAVTFDPNAVTDLRQLQLNWWNKMFIRFRAVRGFVGTLILGEGDWRNLFLQSGKPFTANDLASIRKYNRLLDSLNDYSQMRLVVRAFANEPAFVYNHLTSLTAAETQQFEQGFMTVDSYVNAIKVKGKGLPLNDIVYEAQSRILNVIETCNRLGGRIDGANLLEGDIVKTERNVSEAQDNLNRSLEQIKADRAAGDRQSLRRHIADRDLARERLDLATRVLEDKSLDFVKNRDMVEIFDNLRTGKVNDESVSTFDMSDAFVVPQNQLDAWAEIYERSLARSVNLMVKDELTLAAKTQVGETRKVVGDLNKLTKQVDGRVFTDTEFGKTLEDYAQGRIATTIIRIGKFLGVSIPTAEAARIGKTQIDKYIKSLNTEITTGKPMVKPGETPMPGKPLVPETGPGLPGNPNSGIVQPLPKPNPNPNPVPGSPDSGV